MSRIEGEMGSPKSASQQLDDPSVTEERRALIRKHPYLHDLYMHWYRLIEEQLPDVEGDVLELGSGGGFLEDVLPGLVTSDILPVSGVSRIVDATRLPFEEGALRAIVGTNVLHHIQGIELFLDEATRVLVPGGRVIFIEPWPTPWSLPIYKFLHHEPFDRGRDWSIPEGGPLTAANGALPWIVCRRDEEVFVERFPEMRVLQTSAFMPFSYLACGGLERAYRIPAVVFRLLRILERPLDSMGMFALIVIGRSG